MKETLQIPTPETLEALIGKELYDIWTSLCQLIEQKYNMEQLWNHGGKKWIYEYIGERCMLSLITLCVSSFV